MNADQWNVNLEDAKGRVIIAPDVNRGLTTKYAFALGFPVDAYNAMPGSFFDDRGNPIPDGVAAKAGFDVPRLKVLRDIAERHDALKTEMAEVVAQRAGPVVVAENAAYRLIEVEPDIGQLLMLDGTALTPAKSMSEATALFNALGQDD